MGTGTAWGQGARPRGGPLQSTAPGGAPTPHLPAGRAVPQSFPRTFHCRRPSLRPRGRGCSFAVAQGSGGRLRPSREAILVAAVVSRSRPQRLLLPSVATQSEPPAPAPHAGMEGSAAPTPVPSNPDG